MDIHQLNHIWVFQLSQKRHLTDGRGREALAFVVQLHIFQGVDLPCGDVLDLMHFPVRAYADRPQILPDVPLFKGQLSVLA
eukprot:CAMPEP_0204441050 /NCGR_PEP_ID=MMETSP0470-20130426/84461_1 /ASSEMBLY_ACC=CAM_ASM_000385 /TAXON_ID=2969 /ORGANISM="Oxyrrhis marina" /LENGTH=80 /DNA_ID=CAMNT_0051440143 /DNA_START=473 /DNA_END=715 /DNA_ORIENTATION=+